MVDAIVREIHLRRDYLNTKELTSIYFGGGTPSLLTEGDLVKIFDALGEHYQWTDKTEITLEANPDDLSIEKLQILKASNINRLSIGVQSFFEEDLKYMNRAHNAKEAIDCINTAQKAGFTNITADLIYGSPTTTIKMWQSNIRQMIDLGVDHISAYALTIEEGTALQHFIQQKKTQAVDEEKTAQHFDILLDMLYAHGYEQYEISNFAKPGHQAIHNTNYWKGKPYLGIGPAAHSFDGKSKRAWNIAHNPQYIKSINQKKLPIEEEHLTDEDCYNEFVLIRLRTKWGITIQELHQKHPKQSDYFIKKAKTFISSKHMILENDRYMLTQHGKLMADKISMELFVD